MFEIREEKDLVWIMYFTTEQYIGNIDGLFNIQKFERRLLPNVLRYSLGVFTKSLGNSLLSNF